MATTLFRMDSIPFCIAWHMVHEMGHGLTAILLRGTFEQLQIFQNGSGVAYTSLENSYLPVNIARACTAAGGLLGPAITGALLISSAKNHKSSMIILRLLIGLMTLSVFLWIRSFWGIAVMGGYIIALTGITFLNSRKLEVITILFLGIQSVLTTFFQIDYLFTKQFEKDGIVQISDTQAIAQNTFGFYWMWAILIIVASVYLLWKSFRFYWSKK